jgi:hypothetical protein
MSVLSQTSNFGRVGTACGSGLEPESNFARTSDPPGSGLRCPIYNCVYKGFGLTDRIQSGGANADRNRFGLSYGPFPTAWKAHFDDGETDAAMFHGGPPLTFSYAPEATAFASAGLAQLRDGHGMSQVPDCKTRERRSICCARNSAFSPTPQRNADFSLCMRDKPRK